MLNLLSVLNLLISSHVVLTAQNDQFKTLGLLFSLSYTSFLQVWEFLSARVGTRLQKSLSRLLCLSVQIIFWPVHFRFENEKSGAFSSNFHQCCFVLGKKVKGRNKKAKCENKIS
jgi:preprotein translocase subunit SecF